MNFFRLLLASSFCLLCLMCIGITTKAATITINELDINWRPKADVDFPTEKDRADNNVYANVIINVQSVDFPTGTETEQPYVTVRLSEVTNWKGICGNQDDPQASPFPNDPPNPDLVL